MPWSAKHIFVLLALFMVRGHTSRVKFDLTVDDKPEASSKCLGALKISILLRSENKKVNGRRKVPFMVPCPWEFPFDFTLIHQDRSRSSQTILYSIAANGMLVTPVPITDVVSKKNTTDPTKTYGIREVVGYEDEPITGWNGGTHWARVRRGSDMQTEVKTLIEVVAVADQADQQNSLIFGDKRLENAKSFGGFDKHWPNAVSIKLMDASKPKRVVPEVETVQLAYATGADQKEQHTISCGQTVYGLRFEIMRDQTAPTAETETSDGACQMT